MRREKKQPEFEPQAVRSGRSSDRKVVVTKKKVAKRKVKRKAKAAITPKYTALRDLVVSVLGAARESATQTGELERTIDELALNVGNLAIKTSLAVQTSIDNNRILVEAIRASQENNRVLVEAAAGLEIAVGVLNRLSDEATETAVQAEGDVSRVSALIEEIKKLA